MGRSRGGLTTKIHMVCDANGVPLRFLLSPGQASDISNAQALLDQVRIPGKQGRPRKRCRWLLADKGYDAEHLRQYCDRYRMQPVIPLRTMKCKPKPGLPRLFDRPKYRQRNIIERMFGWLKESRRIGTRYDKLARSFAAMVTLACMLRCLRQYVQNLVACLVNSVSQFRRLRP
ncbi:Transposase [Pseudomonas indica]|uniref:Transposase n=1 Tax=Pseudomonas indica TaxID=137658 RepID=A0A1G9HRX8_9PSED|nr:Transposase [Pseudomonas indica]